MTELRKISILGSTGSIGKQTLDIARANGDLKITALAANRSIRLLEQQVREFRPEFVCVYDEQAARDLKVRLGDLSVRVVSGMDGLIEAAAGTDAGTVVGAVVGMIGIRPVIEAIRAGKDIALANKETLVCAGHLIMPMLREYGVRILPVDSEHSAIFQSLRGNKKNRIAKILLTASGGPFRNYTAAKLKKVTLEDALKHPNWSMGKKVTIDSSTMVNKGLEVMEAHWLFNVDYEDIQVVIQPQSIIHSMVEYEDGAVMKLPIQYALYYPKRRFLGGGRLDFAAMKSIEIAAPDMKKFPGLKLAYEAGRTGGSMPTVFNAANEAAVRAFLEKKIGWGDIAKMIASAMEQHEKVGLLSDPQVEDILAIRRNTEEWLAERFKI